jgi:hypothetical protein
VSVLIDGNNLLFALSGAGCDLERQGLARLLSRVLARQERVHVVFDGPPPSGPLADPVVAEGVRVTFSGKGPADGIIIKLIAADSAPRQLTVVSTDHEIRRAAHRRRCKIALSEEFARLLLHAQRAGEKPKPGEEEKKPDGLSPEQVQKWLDEFGLG